MRIGIVGAGQLGRMLGLSGLPLGQTFSLLDPSAAPCGRQIGRHIRADFHSIKALTALAQECDVTTFEFENVDTSALQALADAGHQVFPPPVALATAQDRCQEKKFFRELGIQVADWRAASNEAELRQALTDLGDDVFVKTARLGYDGKGQRRPSGETAAELFRVLGSVELCVERRVPFDEELSIIGTRSLTGELRTWRLCRNEHRQGVLYQSRVDAVEHPLQSQADEYFRRVTDALDYVGTLTIEFFACANQLIANEMAPRVHNSGHWSIEGASTSQFENHVRAIAGLPLGATENNQWCGMQNFVGALPSARAVLQIPNCHFHHYDKTVRPGRKVGHATVTAKSRDERDSALEALAALPVWELT